MDVPARVRAAGALGGTRRVPARVIDLSPGGARIEVTRWLEEGEPVALELPHEARAAPGGGAPSRVVRGRIRSEGAAQVAGPGRYRFGLVFARSLGERLRLWSGEHVSWLALVALAASLVPVVLLKEANVTQFWLHPLANTYGLLVSGFIVSRLVLAYLYRPPPDTGYRPTVSVVVVCKNEEASIRETLECVYRSDYRRDLLEVIAVDDGSTDGTLAEMQATARAHPDLQVVSFERNRGKRHGMAAGALLAKGEVLVYVDSDSFLRPEAVAKLASAFSDRSVGAVCGHADVQNARANFLTKMQEVRYYVAFRVVKAAESVFSAVTCCSGCLAAYRRSAVLEVLDPWLGQTFLGTPATFGDDRALTRYMLKRHRVVYHAGARCTTIVPERWGVFFRQQLRWKKSWIRENLLLSAFIWKRHPLMVVSFYMSVLFPLVSPGIVLHALVLPLAGWGTFSFVYIYGAVLMSSLYALVYLARHRDGLWIYGVWFSLFYMVALVWQTYWALLTVRQNQWGTR